MTLDDALRRLADDPRAPLNLAEIALRLAQDEYSHLDVEGYLSELVGMGRDARSYLRGSLEAKVHGFCRYLFHEMGFRGNTRRYYDPRNSYLNEVIDRRTGLPITLSMVAMSVAGQAGLEVVGLGLPGHFLTKAVSGGDFVLFDPFHGGRLLSPEECQQLVEQVTGRPFLLADEHLQATPPGLILARMLKNLKGVYLRLEDYSRLIRVTERLRQLAPHDISQRRDLGASYLQAGLPGKAIAHLEAYLSAQPEPSDAAYVQQLIRQAQSQVAKWN
jgi:regulator of sirC expression with transglutaminase-like and TPR domain